MRFNLLQILQKADEMEKEEMVQFLKDNMKYPLEVFLASIHNPHIEFEIFRNLEYKQKPANRPGFSDSYIEHQVKRMYVYEKRYPVPIEKKREILIKSLELMCKEEQDLLLAMIRKENPFKNITKPIVKRVNPDLISEKYVLKRP